MATRSFSGVVLVFFLFASSASHAQGTATPALDAARLVTVGAPVSLMGSAERFTAEEARTASARQARRDPLWNGPLIGFAIGGGIGLLGAAGCHQYSSCGSSTAEFFFLYGGIGAAAGLAIDALLTRPHTADPGAASPGGGTMHLAPLLTGSRTGVIAAWRY